MSFVIVHPPVFRPSLNGSSKLDRAEAVRSLLVTLDQARRELNALYPNSRDYYQGQYPDGLLALGHARQSYDRMINLVEQMAEIVRNENEEIL